jgi:hypothetical protein
VTRRGERAFGVEHRDVEVAEATLHPGFLGGEFTRAVAQALPSRLQPGDLVTGEMQPDRPQLFHEPAVATRRVGLALQRGELAAHLTEQVVEAQEVALGGLEAALGALAPLAELQDAGRFLDDRAAILGARVQHRVELTLADDHVLLATDPGVGQQLLDVEQPARRAVDLVLGVARPEERAGDRDLAELDRQQAGRVVDAQ